MEGWKEYKIKDVCQIVGGYAFKSKDFKKEGDIPIVKIKSLLCIVGYLGYVAYGIVGIIQIL